MKRIAFLILLGVMTSFAFAQTAQSTMIEFNKTRVPGVIVAITSDYDVATVQAALQARMERIGGLKGSNSGKFRMYGGQIFTDFGSTKYDIYTRVLPKDKKNKDIIVDLLVSLGHENFVSLDSDPQLTQKMIDFLNNFATTYLVEFDRSSKISTKTKNLEKLEKEYKKLVSNRDKTKNNLEKQEKAVESKAAEITKIKEALGILRH
jgi:beta-phosphoglucomutase-like phosphatase (HAD superfamily)